MPYWAKVSKEAKDFVQDLLELDQEKRLSPQDALKHPWFGADGGSNDLSEAARLIKRYQAVAKLRKGCHAVIASNKVKRIFEAAKSAA